MRNTRKIIEYNRRRLFLRKKFIEQTKKDKDIIYGARSINAQIGLFGRGTEDYDVYSKNPKKSANKIESTFNKTVGYNLYYTKPALHPGTHKVMFIGNDFKKGTKDDVGIIDYTNLPKPKPKIRIINGVQYRALSEESKAKRKSLSDKEFAFRHKKDRGDLQMIQRYNQFKRGLKRI